MAHTLVGRDGVLRPPRPRSSGLNNYALCVNHAISCAAERGADGASAPSLPCRRKAVNCGAAILDVGSKNGRREIRVIRRIRVMLRFEAEGAEFSEYFAAGAAGVAQIVCRVKLHAGLI